MTKTSHHFLGFTMQTMLWNPQKPWRRYLGYHIPKADSLIAGSDFIGIGTGTYSYFDKDGCSTANKFAQP